MLDWYGMYGPHQRVCLHVYCTCTARLELEQTVTKLCMGALGQIVYHCTMSIRIN